MEMLIAPQSSPSASNVSDVTTATFMQHVVQSSSQQPVIVYFWAPWCNTCKIYGPMLEKQVSAAGAAIRLAKVNMDTNTQIAAQLQVQSVPTTYIFVNGQPVDAFAGAIKESDIAQLIKQFSGNAVSVEPPIEEWLSQAEALIATGNADQAQKIYTALYAQAPENSKVIAAYAQWQLSQGKPDTARDLIATLPATVKDPALDTVRAALKLMESAAGDRASLEKSLAQNPVDHDSRYQLATLVFTAGQQQEGIDHLLAIIEKDPEWQERKARAQLLTFFEALGVTHPFSIQGRRKLSSLLFS